MATQKLSDFFEAYYYGKEGETLFWQPFPTKIVVHDNSLDLVFSRSDDLDDRSVALVSAMISENYIDRMLKLLLPSFSLDRQGAASKKIDLLTAFNIIPKHLTKAAQLLNQTRNEFAHHLKLTSFAELDNHKPSLTKAMRGLCQSRNLRVPQDSGEVSRLFEIIFQMATTGINRFEENVRFYTNYTRTQPFIKLIGDLQESEVRQHNQIFIDVLRQHQSSPKNDA